MVSPKIGPSFFGKNYERYVSELTTEGTIGGEKLTPEERKEGFKKKGDKINFKNFLEKVLERLPPDAQKKITEGEINRVNFNRYEKKISADSVRGIDASSASTERKELGASSSALAIAPAGGIIDPSALMGVDEVVEEKVDSTLKEKVGGEDVLEDLDELLKFVREEKDVKEKAPTVVKKSDTKILANLKETNKNLLETNEILYGLIKSLQKEMIEDKKRAFKEKDRLRKEKRKASFGSSVVKSGSGRIAKGKKPSLRGGGLFDNPLFKFLGLSALAGLVEFIPKIVEFVETLPEKINKFFTKDVPDFIGKKFEEFKNLVGGFFTDRFNEVKQFFEDIYTGIDDFTGGRLTDFIEGIKGLGPMIVEKSQEFYKTIDDWTGGRISGAFDWIGKNVIDPLGAFFTEKIDYVKDEAGKLWENFSSSFLNFFGDIKFELPEFPDLGVTELASNVLGLEPAVETGPDLTQDLVAVGGTTAANIAPISGATGMAVEGMDAAQVANQIPNMNVGGKSVQLGTGLSQGGTGEDVQKQISGLKEGGAKGVQVLGTGDAEKDATLQEIVAQNKDFATFLPAVKSETGGIDYGATAAASTQQIQSNAAMREQESTSIGAMSDNQRGALDALAKYESGAAGYDAVNQYGTKGGRGVEGFSGDIKKMPQHKGRSLTDMTLSEIKQLQYDDKSMSKEEWINAGKLHAVGRYQFIGNTLPGVAERAGIPDNAKFSPQVQDIMALQLIKERGISPWVGPSDKATAEERAIIELSRTEALPKVSITSGKPQQRQPQRSPQPVSAALTGTLDKIDSGQMAHTTSGTRKPSVVSTSAVIPNRDSISVTSRRGMRDHPVSGGQKMHQGTDIAAPSGTPLYAFTDGVITDRGHDNGYGNYMAWKDSFGSEHFYAHMTQMSANVGDTVKAGTIIGKSGGGANDPGRGTSTGAHLHWEYGPVGETGRNGAGLVDPLDKFDYMMPFGAKKIISSPEPTPTPAPKPTSITAAPSRTQTTADVLSKTPSRASRSRVSNINLPAEVINNPTIAGSSGGQSSSTENYVPRVSTRTSSDIYQINTRALFNIVG